MSDKYKKMKLTINSLAENESFARSTVAGFCFSLNPTLDEINDIKTIVSEGVTNCIVHGYKNDPEGSIEIEVLIIDKEIHIEIRDQGVGIKDVTQAMQPFYTTAESDERSGMGFTVMQTFCDALEVVSSPNNGTTLKMIKKLG